MTGHLDYILVHNYFYADEFHLDRITNQLRPLAETHGFTYTARTEPDIFIEMADIQEREYFSEGAVVYVHGDKLRQHPHFNRVLELPPLRPDLRFVMEFDNGSDRDDFSSPKVYQRYRELPFLNEELKNSARRDAPIVAFYKNVDCFPPIEEGTPMADYILHLLEGRK